jgi:hypothetical protein
LAQLEDFVKSTLENKELVKKMNKSNAKALNAMKQDIRKYNKAVEADVESWRSVSIYSFFSMEKGGPGQSREDLDNLLTMPILCNFKMWLEPCQ